MNVAVQDVINLGLPVLMRREVMQCPEAGLAQVVLSTWVSKILKA